MRRWPWILLGSWMSVKWQKILCWFPSCTKKTKTKTKTKTYFHCCLNETNLKTKKACFWKYLRFQRDEVEEAPSLSFFCFWTELCKQSILRASNSVNSLTNNWILWKFRTLKAEPQILSGASQIRVLERRERSEAHSLPLINRIAPNHGIALNYCFKHLGRKFSWPTIQLLALHIFRTRKSKTMTPEKIESQKSANLPSELSLNKKIKTLNHSIKIHKDSRKIMD